MISAESDAGPVQRAESDLGLVVAARFGLGRPVESMLLHQHTSFRTWRLRTEQGSFLVKELWESGPPYWSDKAQAMTAYEQAARGGSIRIPRAAASDGQLLVQIGDVGAFKVYEWIDTSSLECDLRLAGWLGRTLATLHRLDHADRDLTPASDWFGVYELATWNVWLESARKLRLDWHSALQDSLPCVLEISDRISGAWNSRSDKVVSHGDLEPYNVLDSDRGLFLIDWESVGWESAGLELGRTAFAFGEHDLAFSSAVLGSYVEAGGNVPQIDGSFGLRAVARKLGNLTELVRAGVEDAAPTGWMQSSFAVLQAIEELLSISGRAVEWSSRLATFREGSARP